MGTLSPTMSGTPSADSRSCSFSRRRRRFSMRMARDEENAIDRKRLLEEIVSAQLGRLDGRFDRPVSGNHHHYRTVRLRDALNPAQGLKPVDAGQPDVENHQLEDRTGQPVQTGLAAFDRFDLKAFVLEHTAQRLSNAGFVVDDQNSGGSHARGALPR